MTSVDDTTQSETQTPKVAIVMGSDSDLPVMEETAAILRKFAIPFDVPWSQQISLVNIIDIKRISKIWIFNALGNVRSFF